MRVGYSKYNMKSCCTNYNVQVELLLIVICYNVQSSTNTALLSGALIKGVKLTVINCLISLICPSPVVPFRRSLDL